jgi:hypothetical protein
MKNYTIIIVMLVLLQSKLINCLSPADTQKIGMQIWKNESGQHLDLLVHWHKNETFPSFGIGHNIWFLTGQEKKFNEQFPQLCTYLEKNGVKLPQWLQKVKNSGAPWKNREEFLKDYKKINNLCHLLSVTIELQTEFMIERLDEQWPKILQHAPKKQQTKLMHNYKLMRSTLLGTYTLIDYLNFKGSGLDPKEESNGQRWGLLQVLLDMPDGLTKDTVNQAFTLSAIKILVTLVQNSAPEYNRMKFLNGWIKRLNTYSSPETFNAA